MECLPRIAYTVSYENHGPQCEAVHGLFSSTCENCCCRRVANVPADPCQRGRANSAHGRGPDLHIFLPSAPKP